ncbi:Lrp/AsnC family transcriptional regulator (plasmid) [Leisingera aquaemixtae]|jgi:Lrp/AsnC family leucine-responsive transcriptional regulator|uniref:Leucine-responsive regulatory protein n=1 Tax=Leisingera aquaemixtae TaxID=1396826 RepID=A0A0P1HNB2_9RHOB|nr:MULTISPECIES: Lrp/AsnC family transcriptional regulator [Leisingera]EDZ45019.1 transcriptional regulator, AsnC family [Rhodobacterales bacterium Y4I]QDI74313.1 Lrp/AsnC family transcriptional regulator [Leisingera aquaemixtae]UWQ27029.1 Lrp/AsnC family transcriptional regulator [Leisingera aquaemixtae]UWQ43568.1 Lrp/AsnC family transcriptional regulator [Leisingera aquaemixtae]CUH98630.1 Leucine-responsive regulatory protein [Leisingera aquaemixtae]
MVVFATDSVDREILRALRDDGRIPLVQLAARVGLSQTPCKRRLQRLEESGLISGYIARIDRKAAGFGITAFVSVELERQDADEIARFQKRTAQFEEVVTGTLMTGAQDFLLEIVVESLEEFETFLQTKLLRIPGIRVVRSRFALRKFIDRARIP